MTELDVILLALVGTLMCVTVTLFDDLPRWFRGICIALAVLVTAFVAFIP
jgi:uncharacterized membrane protein YhdT